ncbi:Dna-Directed Rna polymerase Iii Subunit Rpc7-Like [Manis pentadactyla]|nr:Dna-Directed Rna polymerase Iii Subunit Rpc7-Like [Manis pentadactyla]
MPAGTSRLQGELGVPGSVCAALQSQQTFPPQDFSVTGTWSGEESHHVLQLSREEQNLQAGTSNRRGREENWFLQRCLKVPLHEPGHIYGRMIPAFLKLEERNI